MGFVVIIALSFIYNGWMSQVKHDGGGYGYSCFIAIEESRHISTKLIGSLTCIFEVLWLLGALLDAGLPLGYICLYFPPIFIA